MSIRTFRALSVVAVLAAGPVPASGQSAAESVAAPAADWTAPRTAWGAPDLQGVWDYRSATPLERPAQFAGKATLTPEEAAAYEREQNRAPKRLRPRAERARQVVVGTTVPSSRTTTGRR